MIFEKIVKFNICALFILVLVSCSNSRGANKNIVKDALNTQMNKDLSVEETEESINKKSLADEIYENIDIDLTSMPQQLAYTTSKRMNFVYEDYIGQTVKMKGICSIFHDEKNDKYYYILEVNDDTACCVQGVEFELIDEYKFPDDFPKEKDEVTVVGIFDVYKEGATTYKTLRKAVLA